MEFLAPVPSLQKPEFDFNLGQKTVQPKNISQTEKMFDTSSSSVKSVLPPRSLSAYAMNNSFIAFSLLEKIANKCSNAILTKVFCLKRLTINAITKRPASATHHSDDVVSPSRSDAHQDVFQPSCPILVRENTEGGSGERNTSSFTVIDKQFFLNLSAL